MLFHNCTCSRVYVFNRSPAPIRVPSALMTAIRTSSGAFTSGVGAERAATTAPAPELLHPARTPKAITTHLAPPTIEHETRRFLPSIGGTAKSYVWSAIG